MSSLIFAFSCLISFIGIGVAIWSILDTRKKYFMEYKARKKNGKN